MAYKFMRGAAKLSGSIIAEEGLDAGTQGLNDAGAIAGATTVAASGLANLNGGIEVDNGGNKFTVSTAGVVSGSGNINGGAGLNIQGNGVFGGTLKIDGTAQGAVAIAEDSILFIDATDGVVKKEGVGAFATDLAGTGLEQNGNQIRIAAAAAGGGLGGGGGSALAVEVSGAVHLEPGNGKVAITGSFAGRGLESEGGVDSISALAVKLETSNALAVTDNGLDLKNSISGNRTFANNVTITGDLTVNGTNTILNTSTLVVEDHIITISSGSNTAQAVTNEAGLEFGTTGPTLKLNTDVDGAGADGFKFSLPVSASEMHALNFVGNASTATVLQTARTIGGVSFNGSAAIVPETISILDDESTNADRLIMFAAADGTQQPRNDGDLKYNPSTGLVTATAFAGNGAALTGVVASGLRFSQQVVAAGAVTASADFIMVDTSSPREIRMPNIDAAAVGRMFVLKDVSGDGGLVTIKGSVSNHNLDGEASIILESNFAAVNLMACSASGVGFFYSIF